MQAGHNMALLLTTTRLPSLVTQAATSRPLRTKRGILLVQRYKNGDNDSDQQQAAEAVEAALPQQAQVEAAETAKVVFQLPHHVEWGQDMCLVGETEALGGWDVDRCVPMAWHDGDVWTAEAELPKGAQVEYKYIVREGQDGDTAVKDVREWQPCNNLELQVAAGLQEVTVRDAWEGSLHEVLPGLLPMPVSAEVPSEDAPAEVAAVEAVLPAAEVVGIAPAAVAADLVAAAVPASPAVDIEDLVGGSASDDEGELPASGLQDAPVLTAEQIAASSSIQDTKQAPAKAAAPVVLGGDGSTSDAVVAHDTVHAGADGNIREHIKEVRKEDATVPAWLKQASSEVADDYDSLATSQLKELCKRRGLSSKGQRSQLLARLHQRNA